MGKLCGPILGTTSATRPLVLAWNDPSTGAENVRETIDPALVIGRNPKSHIVLDDPSVGLRHAVLVRGEGGLFAVDLESRNGLCWEGVRRPCGWVGVQRSFWVGSVEIRVSEGVGVNGARSQDGASVMALTMPGSADRTPGPAVYLDVRQSGLKTRRCPLDRGLALVGASALCQVRLRDPNASRFVCALVRTGEGVWAIDLLSTAGLIVNGALCRAALLEDGDQITVGAESVRVLYGDILSASAPSRSLSDPVANTQLAGVVGGPVATVPTMVASPVGEFASEAVFLPLLERTLSQMDQSVFESPIGEALVLMAQLLGEVQRDHLALVRDELAPVRRLGREIDELQAAVNARASATSTAAAPGSVPGSEAIEEPAPRLDPMAALRAAEERLSVWNPLRHRERNIRWRWALQRFGYR